MTKLRRERIASALVVVSALVLTQVAAQMSSAQKKGDPAPPSTGNQPRPASAGTDANQSFLDLELLVSGKSLRTSPDEYRRQLAAQFDIDIRRLEQLNDEQLAPLLHAGALDYKTLSRTAAEIRDRATRIKYNATLSLKKKGEKVQYEEHGNELDSMLPELSSVIKSFTGNPVFHERDRNDAELRSAAGHDLEGIIKLSGTINKIAKRLARASHRSA